MNLRNLSLSLTILASTHASAQTVLFDRPTNRITVQSGSTTYVGGDNWQYNAPNNYQINTYQNPPFAELIGAANGIYPEITLRTNLGVGGGGANSQSGRVEAGITFHLSQAMQLTTHTSNQVQYFDENWSLVTGGSNLSLRSLDTNELIFGMVADYKDTAFGDRVDILGPGSYLLQLDNRLTGTPDNSANSLVYQYYWSNVKFQAVPEPGTLCVLGLGLAALVRKKRK